MKLHEVFAKKTYGPDSTTPAPDGVGKIIHDGYFVKIREDDSVQKIQQEIEELERMMDGGHEYDPEFGVRDQSELEEAEFDMKMLEQRLAELR